jgi:cell division protease FtsH
MENNKNQQSDPKKGFPTTFFLLLLGVILIVLTVQNLMSTKQASVAFSHQVEHLVNLQLIVPEESHKVALKDNLVTFSGRFRDQVTENGNERYKFLELLAENNALREEKEQVSLDLDSAKNEVIQAAHWYFVLSGRSIDPQGYTVVSDIYDIPGHSNEIVIFDENNKEIMNLRLLRTKLSQMSSQMTGGASINGIESELTLFSNNLTTLVENFRSPLLGIGSDSMKQQLKGMQKELQDLNSTVPIATRIVTYDRILTELQSIVNTLDEPVDGIRLSQLRSLRNYKDEMQKYSQLSSALTQNIAKLEKARTEVAQVIWFFNNKELSTRALEKVNREEYTHWFIHAKEEWTNFDKNKGLFFRAPDQPRTLALEKTFKSEDPAPNYLSYLFTLLPIILIMLLLYFVFSKQMKGMGGGAMNFGKSPARLLQQGENKITFKDVAGIDEAKEELVEVVEFLKNPSKFTALGGRIPKGVLCVGPPGTGKTLIAKAVAGEADRPFFSISGSDFVEMFVGVGASRIRDMFAQAKKQSPCIIFIDEIDAVGRHRGAGIGGGHDEREQTLNQLLVEMDGFETEDGVILMAATNRPDVLDKALLRPGRFDRRVIIGLPDIKGRFEILKVHARKIKIDPNVDLLAIARGVPGASGADLKNLLNEAALLAARKNRTAVTMSDLAESRDKVLYGKERRSLELDDNEKRTTAYHESGHAIVGLVVEHSDPVDKVTIIPRGFSLGATHFLPEKNRLSYWKKEMLDQLAVLMGGRVAEEIFIGDISSGAQQDISQATKLARNMVCAWGMSNTLGAVAYDERTDDGGYQGIGYSEKSYSQETARAIDDEVRRLLDEAHDRASKIILENREKVELMTLMLIEFETLDAKDVEDIMNGIWSSEEKKKRLEIAGNQFKKKDPTPPPLPPVVKEQEGLGTAGV